MKLRPLPRYLRPRTIGRWALATALLFGLVGLLQADGLKAKTGLAQYVRQSAWDRALADAQTQTPWPWEVGAQSAAQAVPRLGLSAAVLKDDGGIEPAHPVLTRSMRPAASADARDPHLELGEVTVGDRITVTTADGLSHVYKVTGRQMIDSGRSELDADPANGGAQSSSCSSLETFVAGALRLVIETVNADAARMSLKDPEQKL